jgi:hypothetical protein
LLIEQVNPVNFPGISILKNTYNSMVAVLPVMCMAKMDDRAVDGPDHIYCERVTVQPLNTSSNIQASVLMRVLPSAAVSAGISRIASSPQPMFNNTGRIMMSRINGMNRCFFVYHKKLL